LKIWNMLERIDTATLESLMTGGNYLETWKFVEQNIFSMK
jgi:hypothetical protein